MTSFFADNLQVLSEIAPHLAERICWCVESDHIVRFPDTTLHYKRHQEFLPLELTSVQIEQALSSTREGPVFIFGAGLGELVTGWLDNGGGPVTAWERDPFLLRLFLDQRDWREELRSGRLTLALGVDLVEMLRTLRKHRADLRIAFHPLLGEIYRNERLLLTEIDRPTAFIVQGALFIDDVSDALREQGFSVYTLDMERLSMEELDESVQRVQPTLLVRINHIEGLAQFAEKHALKTITWEIDPALTAPQLAPQQNTQSSIFTFRRAHVDLFIEAGFSRVSYLPLAANPVRRTRVELSQAEEVLYAVPLAFVGASMAHRTAELRRDFISTWARAFPERSQEGAAILEEVLSEQRKDFSCYRVPHLLAGRGVTTRAPRGSLELDALLGELAAAERRIAYIKALVPLGIHVWGDEGWKSLLSSWRGPAEHGNTLNRIYSHALVNVDIGRLYQLDIVTMRVFDVLACGGFILAEHSDDLAELFRIGEEVDSWRTLEELVEKSRWYLNNRDVARRIGQRGQTAVKDRHTIKQRISEAIQRASL